MFWLQSEGNVLTMISDGHVNTGPVTSITVIVEEQVEILKEKIMARNKKINAIRKDASLSKEDQKAQSRAVNRAVNKDMNKNVLTPEQAKALREGHKLFKATKQ